MSTTDHKALRTSVLRVPVDPFGQDQIVDIVMKWTDGPHTHVAVGVNAMVCNLAATNDDFHGKVMAADLSYADGQSVVWAARLLGGRVPERVATTDLIDALASISALTGKKLFFYGAKPGVAERAASQLRHVHPDLQVATRDGYVSHDGMPQLIDEINASGAHILFVGLGEPRQQDWVSQYRDRLTVPAILTCGGLFDWVSGDNKRAPAWMIAAGLEWLWRLIIEPRRLASRYLLGNPAFLYRLGKQVVSVRRGSAR
ncbi:WecB/TagA/CpsF family glycosyltransferase [Cryobacterium gelidum]|uniref:Glycosyltransferase n=1 Tax=Cryobacterium gelidum TaxID=1259164 RepID=A0A4R9APC3_9MICO|nr:WecB/TagA/CpsF family glycosyltransferase [Cryobacterium gelidum]TFD66681.1 glycosyltransferase [Cryobacterium gelidum]